MSERLFAVLGLWLAQWRQPRYRLAGVLHILIFAGFLVLSVRSVTMVMSGFMDDVLPGYGSLPARIYGVIKDYAATWVLIACIVAAVRRGIIKPARYAVAPRYGKDHTAEAVFVLGLISLLMVSESLFEASLAAARSGQGAHAEFVAPGSLVWIFQSLLAGRPVESLQAMHIAAYFVHDLAFFFFLCFLPMGKHFHVITSLFNVFFMRLDKGNIKPVRHGSGGNGDRCPEIHWGQEVRGLHLETHTGFLLLCADCGRCSDNCPANATGRPLSPRFISIKGRNYSFANYPGYRQGRPCRCRFQLDRERSSDKDEIWSCTTCGACEEECPLGIEYIDKIVDLRRGMVDEGNVPQQLQKPLGAIERRGNPWGKMEKKRADWIKPISGAIPIKRIDAGETAEALYFVDSICSYDDRMQAIARATALVLARCGIDFGILGNEEKDCGHEVRRFGEESLFQALKAHNTELIVESGARRIITADPHAYNALRNDYDNLPPVEHVSRVILRGIREGRLRLKPLENGERIHVYHDPCYLGRHNGLYEDPRAVLDSIPRLKRVEMLRSRDRSFCCGGGGLMLFYEPEEEQRMGVLRVRMAVEAGADTIVTACPFCMVNLEDAIKVEGLEGKVEAVDLIELVARQLET